MTDHSVQPAGKDLQSGNSRETDAEGLGRIWQQRAPRVAMVASLVLFGLLVLLGASMSSVGVFANPADGPGQGVTVGEPRVIRSDEYNRSTPWALGLMESGGVDFASPLAEPDHGLVMRSPGGLASTLIFPDTALMYTAGRILPTVVFAFVWWLPSALGLIVLPIWLSRLGVSYAIGIPATLLILLAPSNAWWSLMSAALVAWAALAAMAAIWALERWRARGLGVGVVLLVLLSGLALARLAVSYTPWSIPIGMMILVPSAVLILRGQDRRSWQRGLLILVAVVVVSSALLVLFLLENRAGLQVISETVYPGERRESASQMSLASLFGASHLWINQDAAVGLVDTNRSEISSAYLILVVPAVLMMGAIAWRARRAVFWPLLGLSVPFFVLLFWVTVDLPEGFRALLPLSLTTSVRIVQILGLGATLLFAIVLGAWRVQQGETRTLTRERRWPVTLISSVLVFVVVAAAGTSLQRLNIPTLETKWIIVTSVVSALVVATALGWSTRWWALAPAIAAALAVVFLVNPIQFGFGPLQTGNTAATLRDVDQRHPDGHWMTDDSTLDSVLMANALPSVTGQQMLGPRVSEWSILDPTGASEEAWNRGASYIQGLWSEPGSELTIVSPQADLILVSSDPCGEKIENLGVSKIVSSTPLPERRCLVPEGTTTWLGVERWIYHRR